MFVNGKMRILTVMGPTSLPNKHHAMLLMWALLLLQGMIVITLLFGVFYLVDLQRAQPRYEPFEARSSLKIQEAHEESKAPEKIINTPCPSSPDTMTALEKQVPLYVITATYPRLEQLAELTRLGQTLKHAKNLVWVVADDTNKPTKQVMQLLHRLNITHKYILGQMPRRFWTWEAQPKGVANRNNAINWILSHTDQIKDDSGVVYFADDDNAYDARLFEEIRKTKKISVFPVGLLSGRPVSTPVVKNGKVVDFYEGWVGGREFPIDMAGFAFTVKLLKKASLIENVGMPYSNTDQENGFLKLLNITVKDFQPLAKQCTEILVWHTRTIPPDESDFETISTSVLKETNLGPLSDYWCLFMGTKRCDGTISETANNIPMNTPLRQRIELLQKAAEQEKN